MRARMSEMLDARPAASSDAEVMREPLDSFESALLSCAELMLRYITAELAAEFVEITGMKSSCDDGHEPHRERREVTRIQPPSVRSNGTAVGGQARNLQKPDFMVSNR